MNRKYLYATVIVFIGFIVLASKCDENKDDDIKELVTCKALSDKGGKKFGEVCFQAGQLITDTSGYTEEEEEELFFYLESLGFEQVERCKCQQKLIRWGVGDPEAVDIIGSVTNAPKKGGGVGDIDATVSLDYLVSIPVQRSEVERDTKPIFTRQFDIKVPTARIAVIDTGIDSMGAYLENSNGNNQWHIPRLGGGPICTSGVVDTRQGVNIPDIVNNPIPFDLHGHGTHVSGIAANALELSPLTRIELVSVKVSQGDTDEVHLFSLLCGLYYALEKDPAVINCSLGWEEDKMPEIMRPLLLKMNTQGVLLIAGAGNNGPLGCQDTPRYFWPASYSHAKDLVGQQVVISVGAWNLDDGSDELWEGSNQCFDVAAPGVNILSSYIHDRNDFAITGQYRNVAYSTGTSMAAPFVSYVAASIKARNPTMDPVNIKACIIGAADLRPVGIAPNPLVQVSVLDNCLFRSSCAKTVACP